MSKGGSLADIAVTTSLAVAEYFDKLHKNILRSIELLDCSEEFSRLNFELTSYLDQQGKPRPMYYLKWCPHPEILWLFIYFKPTR